MLFERKNKNNKKENIKEFQEFIKKGFILKLNELEKQRYLDFFKFTYKDNLITAQDNLTIHPRWAIIAGYYAMHDIAKLYLAKQYSIKIVSRVHRTTLITFENFITNKQIEDSLVLLYKAGEIFNKNILGINKEDFAFYLRKGMKERGKSQYYHPSNENIANQKDAKYFLDEIVIPFIKLMEKLI